MRPSKATAAWTQRIFCFTTFPHLDKRCDASDISSEKNRCSVKRNMVQQLTYMTTARTTLTREASGHRDTLGKALQLLWWIVDASSGDATEREWGVRELAHGLHLPPATVHRVLAVLMRHGLIQHNATSGQYKIGMEFYRLALKVSARFTVRNAAIPVMQDLVAQCNETAFLGLYDSFRMEMMFVAAVNSSHP